MPEYINVTISEKRVKESKKPEVLKTRSRMNPFLIDAVSLLKKILHM